ncbi:hypothetical protein BDZ45DRAFT_749613 [Acephala macrosclerotiorum]|nr:hypothetical protein BDZ45DRAFT_749613 [Acephala macrosclerotiorum]
MINQGATGDTASAGRMPAVPAGESTVGIPRNIFMTSSEKVHSSPSLGHGKNLCLPDNDKIFFGSPSHVATLGLAISMRPGWIQLQVSANDDLARMAPELEAADRQLVQLQVVLPSYLAAAVLVQSFSRSVNIFYPTMQQHPVIEKDCKLGLTSGIAKRSPSISIRASELQDGSHKETQRLCESLIQACTDLTRYRSVSSCTNGTIDGQFSAAFFFPITWTTTHAVFATGLSLFQNKKENLKANGVLGRSAILRLCLTLTASMEADLTTWLLGLRTFWGAFATMRSVASIA